MAHKYSAFPGMEDILPGEIEKWQWLEEHARVFFEARGFKEIRTPLLEPTELFTRSIGEASDIVHKEMYTFEDRGGRSMTLRPEMTASVARAVIEHGILKTAKSARLYYLGSMFRAERPQAGRKRQFHQAGVEIVNESAAAVDFEIISLLWHFLKYAGVSKPILRLNDLGETKDRTKVIAALQTYFKLEVRKLCEDCKFRLEKNVLRIFDCKVHSCQPIIAAAPWDEVSPLGAGFQKLTEELKSHQIPFEIKRRLVRGLDYYNGIVFEAASESLGAQDALAGGGRYDGLYSDLGAAPTPSTGFSIGLERLLAVLEKETRPLSERIRLSRVYLALLESDCKAQGIAAQKALELRQKGIRVESIHSETSLSKHLKRANQLGIRFAVILGAEEIEKGVCLVKDLNQKSQSEVSLGELVDELIKKLHSSS